MGISRDSRLPSRVSSYDSFCSLVTRVVSFTLIPQEQAKKEVCYSGTFNGK